MSETGQSRSSAQVELLAFAENFRKLEGRSPRAYCAQTLGEVQHTLGEVQHTFWRRIASQLADCGFDVDLGAPWSKIEQVHRQALESDVDFVFIKERAFSELEPLEVFREEEMRVFLLTESSITSTKDLVNDQTLFPGYQFFRLNVEHLLRDLLEVLRAKS